MLVSAGPAGPRLASRGQGEPVAAIAPRGSAPSSTAAVFGRRRSAAPASALARRRGALTVQSFAVMRAIGLRPPRWMPDFGLEKRRAVLDRFFGPIDRQVYEELLDPQFRMAEQLRGGEAGAARTYGKHDFIELMCNHVAPAIPDFTWSAATDGEVDEDGFAIVTIQVSGHHTGGPFSLPGLPPVEASGRRVVLEQELMRVRVEGGRIKQIEVLPSEGAGPKALYKALGGELPGSA